MSWPRSSILWNERCELRCELSNKALELLGERLRSPFIAQAVLGADGFRAWAEEQRCRAAWGIAAALSKMEWKHWKRKERDYIVRFLAVGLVAPAPWAALSTASALLGLLSRQRGSCDEVDLILSNVGVGKVLMELVQNASPRVQLVALQAIREACDWAAILCTSLEQTQSRQWCR